MMLQSVLRRSTGLTSRWPTVRGGLELQWSRQCSECVRFIATSWHALAQVDHKSAPVATESGAKVPGVQTLPRGTGPLCLRWVGITFLAALLLAALGAVAQEPVLGDYWAHDPSTIAKSGDRYYVYRTAQGIMAKYSTDLRNWTYGGQVFPAGTIPSWTSNAVPKFDGTIWAPDIVQVAPNRYFLYYSVSSWGSQVSAIGLATNSTLNPSAPGYAWVDQGPVIQSAVGSPYNCIDPSVFQDANGTLWMTFGSYWDGIHLIQLDPTTGHRIAPNSPVTRLADNSSIEASCLFKRGSFYYLFVNWGSCCSGIDSTYNIRVGRSTAITGPYRDRSGVSLVNGGGDLFLESTGRFVGPGHAGIFVEGATNWFAYHYYDGNNNGTAALGLARLNWTADGWPALTNDWSALYTFEADAREHLGQFNGTLENGATISNVEGRGRALQLDGTNQYVSLPTSVANASTFAAWAKWNGGGDWQRIFDFGDGTGRYLFLTPRAHDAGMRFGITISGGGAEQRLDVPWAFPTGSWCHVAVTLDGSRGLLYFNGEPVATNTSLTLRPWQVQARSNYLGASQWPDPFFNGQIDSFRIFGRALDGAEIRELTWAHPALAHRYSFASDAWDSIGMAHGTLMGNAVLTNGALKLTGAPGGYVNLPGGLVSGSSALTVEFWASFGNNGDWARVFDFGTPQNSWGSDFVFYSPQASGMQRLGIYTSVYPSTTVNLDIAGSLNHRQVYVACIVDPLGRYMAVYTNGALQKALYAPVPQLSGVSKAWSFIGRSMFAVDAWLNGTIDELRIYDTRLTPEEIALNYLSGPDVLALPVTLQMFHASDSDTFSWPAYAVGFLPERAQLLAPDAQWSAIATLPNLANDRWWLTLPRTNNLQFFRLRR